MTDRLESSKDRLAPGESIASVQAYLRDFARQRDWQQYHNPKNLVMALSVEASELLEIFQWLSPEQAENLNPQQREAASHEMADVFLYLLRLADQLGYRPVGRGRAQNKAK
jgi:hypothetical protein